MPRYRVPVQTVKTEVFYVLAETAEEAMFLALNDDDADFVTSIDTYEGAPEVYYPDIIKVLPG